MIDAHIMKHQKDIKLQAKERQLIFFDSESENNSNDKLIDNSEF